MKDLLSILHDQTVLTDSSLLSIKNYIAKWQVDAFYALLNCNIINETELADRLSKAVSCDRVYNMTVDMVEKSALEHIDFEFARKNDMVPVKLISESPLVIEVAVANPLPYFSEEGEISKSFGEMLGGEFRIVVADLKNIRELLFECYPLESQVPALNREGLV